MQGKVWWYQSWTTVCNTTRKQILQAELHLNLQAGIQHNHPDLAQNYDPFASTDINDSDQDPMPQVLRISQEDKDFKKTRNS